ncbi:MAG: 16S rRNA (guanine(966)-N(2))-methyltransferase RsmD [Defluviitaleaceae bacterium]|nr:16S rRNA (guanine(966)-N(2))-methyltransferase RsmD [Defluviitaleaceae bacterium]
MRVVSGVAKGVSLFSPKGAKTRPTSDFVKENLFNIIRDDVRGTRFLDLFAGSGAIGIEALSRGAESVVFVDFSRESIELVRKNLEKTRLVGSGAIVIKGDALSALKKLGGQKFDIIFIDPPYNDNDLATEVFREICAMDILEDDGYIILEMSRQASVPKTIGLEIFREKEYSGTKLVFLEKTIDSEEIS